MTLYQFMSDSPFLTFFLALIGAGLIALPFKLLNRYLRHRSIREKGWPPAHVDADGSPIKSAFRDDD